ncbi:contact-dependent growth inhibition system immunity protein [Streptomyces sp. B21-079]|uniref:contact-dependent growth inhibition system immunity protein n=1 Tax=Streptomyces sp. B21-079 TaxID=3039409 RepID=UPI002FF07183
MTAPARGVEPRNRPATATKSREVAERRTDSGTAPRPVPPRIRLGLAGLFLKVLCLLRRACAEVTGSPTRAGHIPGGLKECFSPPATKPPPMVVLRPVQELIGCWATATGCRHAGPEPTSSVKQRRSTSRSVQERLRPRLRSAAWDDRPVTRLVDRDRSLEELERDRWPTPSTEASRLVATVHALRCRPIGELTVEDMRLLIGQDVGLAYLLPLALEVLRDDPMAEGDMYEGDLLAAVLTRSPAVWNEWSELGRELGVIVSELTDLPQSLMQETARFLAR